MNLKKQEWVWRNGRTIFLFDPLFDDRRWYLSSPPFSSVTSDKIYWPKSSNRSKETLFPDVKPLHVFSDMLCELFLETLKNRKKVLFAAVENRCSFQHFQYFGFCLFAESMKLLLFKRGKHEWRLCKLHKTLKWVPMLLVSNYVFELNLEI